jgi:glycosyltransferase involved in cell wall biosynthesis
MKIEFVIPTYQRTDHLMCMISSLRAQRSPNWVAHVVADCPPEGTLDKIIDFFKEDDRIKFTILPERYNDWGHTPRNYGLHDAKEDWVIMTGEDNYYTPVFVDHFLDAAKSSPSVKFVFCDMIHNWTNFQYHHIKCKPQYGSMDIGNFMTKTEYAKQLKLNTKNIAADAEFMYEYLKSFPIGDILHIEKPLYVHN